MTNGGSGTGACLSISSPKTVRPANRKAGEARPHSRRERRGAEAGGEFDLRGPLGTGWRPETEGRRHAFDSLSAPPPYRFAPPRPHIPLKLTTLTFAYPGVPAERRAELAPAADAYQRLRDEGVEAFLLSTCLRVEVAVAGGDDLARSALQALYGRSPRPAEVRHEREAFLHLCRVAAGLESPVVGEVEVLGQFRAAVAAFAGTYPRSHPLRRVLDGAVAAARAARR